MNEQKSKNKIKLNFIWQLGIEITNMMLPLITFRYGSLGDLGERLVRPDADSE